MGLYDSQSVALKNNRKIVIRSAVPDDAARIIRLAAAVFAEQEFTITLPYEFRATEETQRRLIESHLRTPTNLFLVAQHRDSITGMLEFYGEQRARRAHTGSFGISVVKRWRGQGIGRALLEALLQWAEERSPIEKVCLSVFSNNDGTIRLYRKLGFKQEGRKLKQFKIGSGKYVDEILMYRFVKGDKPEAPSKEQRRRNLS